MKPIVLLSGVFFAVVNDLGHVVGYDGAGAGFLRINDKFSPFTVPGGVVTFPTSINNAGQIAGFVSLDGVTSRAFLATPVPEPASVGLMSFGIIGLAAWRYRKRRSISSWV